MYYITGHVGDKEYINKQVDHIDLCNMAEELLCRSASSYQTWYELFISPDDGECWMFMNRKRNYQIIITYYD